MRPTHTPTERELSQLMEAAAGSPTGLRDRAMLELLAGCGLTTAELARARRSELGGEVLTVRGRGGTARTATLTSQASYYLQQYLGARHDSSPYLFVRHDRARSGASAASHLTARSVQRALERHRRSAGLRQRITPSALRRAFALTSLKRGLELEHLRRLLGHRYAASTKRLANAAAHDLELAPT